VEPVVPSRVYSLPSEQSCVCVCQSTSRLSRSPRLESVVHLHTTPSTAAQSFSNLWPLNSTDLNSVDYRIWGCLQDHVYQKRTRDINELKQHLVDVWVRLWTDSHWRGHRWVEKAASVSVWKDTISDMSCKSFLFLLTFYRQVCRLCRFFLGIANVYRCYGNWEAGTRRWQWLFWCYANYIVWITEISCTDVQSLLLKISQFQ